MHEQIKAAKGLRDEIVAYHKEVYDFIAVTHESVTKMKISMEDLTDMGYLCREMEKYFDELRKEVRSRKELIGKLLAFHVARQSLNEAAGIEVTIKGELATGTPDVKLMPKVPESGTDEFRECMEYLGVSSSQLDESGDCLRLSFKGMQALVTKLAEEGKPMPPGVTKSWPVYTTTFRRRKTAG